MYVKNNAPNYMIPPYPKTHQYQSFCTKDAASVQSNSLPKKESGINSKQVLSNSDERGITTQHVECYIQFLGHSDPWSEGT
jgi:hypothetical protein